MLAGCLCGFQQFDGPIPISKRLWTFSFASLLGGWGFLVLAGLYLVIDHFKLWSGAPFNFVGMNSILIYILHEQLQGQVPFCGGCETEKTSHMIQMWMQTGAVAIWVLYAYYCHKRKFYLVIWIRFITTYDLYQIIKNIVICGQMFSIVVSLLLKKLL